jgi:uncharacterized protein YodC (DUF2158 family)
MSEALRPGSVVRLKSGGPQMTVGEIDGQYVKVDWFDRDKKHQTAKFSLLQLIGVPVGDFSDEQLLAIMHASKGKGAKRKK